jgi:hypothetical protein
MVRLLLPLWPKPSLPRSDLTEGGGLTAAPAFRASSF